MPTSWRRTALATVLLAVGVAGCAKEADRSSDPAPAVPAATATASPSPTASATATPGGYVAQVNALCEALIEPVLAVNGGQEPKFETYAAQRPRLKELHQEFDAKVAALPVGADERAAADAFEAYRRFIESLDEKLAAAAATGRQEDFDAAWAADKPAFESSPFPRAMREAGIECPAR